VAHGLWLIVPIVTLIKVNHLISIFTSEQQRARVYVTNNILLYNVLNAVSFLVILNDTLFAVVSYELWIFFCRKVVNEKIIYMRLSFILVQ
jgi:hypothetical protein